MTTKELDSVRALPLENQVIAMAMPIVTDRIQRLEAEDRDALFSLLMEVGNHTNDLQGDDVQGICDTILEILEAHPVSVEELDFGKQHVVPTALTKWAEYVGSRIKEERERAQMTQEQLSVKSGLPQSHISRIETAKLSPSSATIEKIAKALGRPVADFDHNAPREG